MKKYIVNLVVPVLALCGFFACSEWTEPESLIDPNVSPGLAPKSAEYYAALRDWKYNTKHPRAFGWFGNWTGKGASGMNRLMGLPDSVDFVSMWGNWWGCSPEQMADKKAVREIKGTRVKICFIVATIGDQITPKDVREEHKDENGKSYWLCNGVKYSSSEKANLAFWGWKQWKEWTGPRPTDSVLVVDQVSVDAAIRKYVDAIADTMIKYDFDGFDYDLERDFGAPGNIASYQDRLTIFFDQMSKYCGPKSGTNRLLCCDGQPNILDPKCGEMLDFFILQAYYATNAGSLDGGSGFTPRVKEQVNNFKNYFANEMGYGADAEREIVSRIILCEDFEQNSAAGGKAGTFTTRDGRKLPPCWGMADYYTAEGYQTGGSGLFHMEYDYSNTYVSIQKTHEDKGMNLDPAKYTGDICYGYLNGMISLMHNPVNPAKDGHVE